MSNIDPRIDNIFIQTSSKKNAIPAKEMTIRMKEAQMLPSALWRHFFAPNMAECCMTSSAEGPGVMIIRNIVARYSVYCFTGMLIKILV